jgi:hypothetical protein
MRSNLIMYFIWYVHISCDQKNEETHFQRHDAGTRERQKAEILVNKLQQKLNQALDSSSASDESNCFTESGSSSDSD